MKSALEVLFDVVARLEGADEAYLHAWAATLGVDALLRKCMDAGYDP